MTVEIFERGVDHLMACALAYEAQEAGARHLNRFVPGVPKAVLAATRIAAK